MSEVKEGDTFVLRLGRHKIEAKILSIRPFAKKEDASKMYQIITDEVGERN